MVVRVITAQVRPDRLDESIRHFQQPETPAIGQLPGFRGVLHLVDRRRCTSLSFTFWQTEADLRVGEREGWLQQRLSSLSALLAGTPTYEIYEVGNWSTQLRRVTVRTGRAG